MVQGETVILKTLEKENVNIPNGVNWGAKKDRIFASYGALKTHTEAKHRGQEPMFVVEN